MFTAASRRASGCDVGQGRRLLVGAAGHGFERHVAVLELPLVVLFEQDGSDEPRNGRRNWKMPTSSARRFTSLFSRSIGLVEWSFGQCDFHHDLDVGSGADHLRDPPA